MSKCPSCGSPLPPPVHIRHPTDPAPARPSNTPDRINQMQAAILAVNSVSGTRNTLHSALTKYKRDGPTAVPLMRLAIQMSHARIKAAYDRIDELKREMSA